MAKNGDYEIPFDRKGNQQHYPEPDYSMSNGYKCVDPVWKQNHEFSDILTYQEYRRGRSAAYFVFKTSDGKERTVFLKEFEQMLPHMVRGSITGTFTYIKRGMNYGTRLVRTSSRENGS